MVKSLKSLYFAEEASDFDFWFGLTNPNGTGYVWDRPDGTPMLPVSLQGRRILDGRIFLFNMEIPANEAHLLDGRV